MAEGQGRAQGLRIALEMEKRGIALYARIPLVTENRALKELSRRLESEERLHYQQFETMLLQAGIEEPSLEEGALISATAADHFYPGGLMQVAREGGLDTPEALLKEAAEAERGSIAFYAALQKGASEADAAAIGAIIQEEEGHLRTLISYQNSASK